MFVFVLDLTSHVHVTFIHPCVFAWTAITARFAIGLTDWPKKKFDSGVDYKISYTDLGIANGFIDGTTAMVMDNFKLIYSHVYMYVYQLTKIHKKCGKEQQQALQTQTLKTILPLVNLDFFSLFFFLVYFFSCYCYTLLMMMIVKCCCCWCRCWPTNQLTN